MGATGACTVQADWQNISGPTCLLNSNGFNTGVQRIVQKDMNPCSGTYNQTKNIDAINYTLCPSNEPNWQPLNDYRCQPCPANTAYTSKIQERKWQDMNPNSATSGVTEWRSTGAQCENSAVWQNTGAAPRCSINEMNLPYGYQENEKRDVNPCSDTYNQVLWIGDGVSSACRKVYVFLDQDDYRSETQTFMYTCDIWVRFYYDVNRTQPANVTNAKITIHEWRQNACDSYEIDVEFNNISGQSIKLYNDVPYEFESSECYYNYTTFSSKYQ
jgi:hypothetical protein